MLQQGQTNAPINYSGLNVGTSQLNLPVPIFGGRRRLSTNAIGFTDFTAKPANGKGKGTSPKADQPHDYFANVILGLCEGVVDSVNNIWADGSTTTVTTLSALGMIFFSGTISQAPWSLMVTKHPSLARAYTQLAYLGAPGLALGESATIPDNAFECVRTSMYSYVFAQPTGGWINPNTHAASPAADILITDFMVDLLTSTQYGFGFETGDIDSASQAQCATYHRAQGLFFSPLLTSQEKLTEIIDRWAQLGNSWIYWTGSTINFVPLGDSAVTGNGVTYTPVQDVAYNLGPADFVMEGGSDAGPIKVTRKDPADCFNRTVLNITDRTLGYIDNPFEWRDDGLVDQFGLRDDSTTQADEICDPGVGQIAVQLLGKRNAYIRNTYAFKTSYRFILCLPGTILTLTEPNIGLNQVRVRVQTISEDEKGQLSFVCEEFPGTVGTYYPPLAAPTIITPTTPVTNIDPGNVNTPAIVEPNSAFTGGVPKIVIAASGGVNWGGCNVLLSFDGTDYSQVGTINAPAVQGLLTANLATYGGANPDTGHTLAADCTESQSTPSPVSHADATALRTLSLVAAQPTLVGGAEVMPTNGELLAFGAVTATGTFAANLTFLERGVYGTTAGAHSIGDQFTLLNVAGTDETSIAFDLPPQYVGQPIWLKFCSFNVFGQALQDPSVVTEYKYTPTGAGFGSGTGGVPATPTGLTAIPGNPGQAILAWNASAATDNVTAYLLYRAPGLSASFGSAALIWTGPSLAYTDTSGAGAFTYFLVAENAIGLSANTAGVNVTVAAAASGIATAVVTVSSSPYAPGAAPALLWYVDITNTSGGALEIDLPGSPAVGQRIVFLDAGGTAATHAFTIKAGSTVIDTIAVNGGWSSVRWNGANWVLSS